MITNKPAWVQIPFIKINLRQGSDVLGDELCISLITHM